MKQKYLRIIAAVLSVVIIATMLSSCSFSGIGSKSEEPVEVNVKTDLRDACFTMSYGELKTVIEADKLATLFEEYDELSDDITIDLSYYDITSRFGDDSDTFKGIMNLLSDEEKATLSSNSDIVLEYFVNSINNAKQAKPVTKYKESFWVDNDTIEFSQGGEKSDSKVVTATEYFSDFVTKGVGKALGDGNTTEKGTDLTDIVYLYGSDKACELTMDNVSSVISSLVKTKETNSDSELVVTGISRIITIILNNDEQSVSKAFSLRGKDLILNEMKKGSSYFTVDDYSTGFDGCVITATFNAVNDDLISVTYDKNMKVNTQVNGVGSLEYLGAQDVTFDCTGRMEYQFGWESEAE